MDVFCSLPSMLLFFICRIYRLFLAVGGACLFLIEANCQEINAYKTISSGDFPSIGIWAVWDGATWNPASVKPTASNDIYIDQTHTLRLISNEAVKNVFINAETGAGQKLNLNNFNLDLYGTLNAFSGAAPGIPANAWNSQNWIGNSLGSTLTFKGGSRVIIHKNSWSAQTTQSRYSVIFEADPGETLTLESPFKALSFTIKSGILFQKIDTSVVPNTCFTLSFNNETTVYGSGPYGNMEVQNGATFISTCNSNILNRSTSGMESALNFDLQNGGILILEGNAPRIEAANFQLNGRVIFRAGSIPKNFLSSSFPDSATPQAVRDLELQGNQNLNLPSQLYLFGNLEKSGTGNFITSSTHLVLSGSNDQEIIGFPLTIQDLTLNKSSGTFSPNQNLTVTRNLTLTQGDLDMEWNNLTINTSGSGSFSYLEGKWRNLGKFTYANLPAVLDQSNGTFPFEDTQNGGIRKVQLLGNTLGGSLSINFTEYEGAEYDPGFDDLDGTEILYRLYSYFQFSDFTPSSGTIQLRISADELIVDDVDDLRVVGTGYPAPGIHVPGTDPIGLWAVRDLTWDDLTGKNFTIGSYRVLSILPVEWLWVKGESRKSGNFLQWEVASEKESLHFEIYRTTSLQKEWNWVGNVSSKGDSSNPVHYQFEDTSVEVFTDYYYQIRQIDLYGKSAWSKVFLVSNTEIRKKEDLLVYPNPFQKGVLKLVFPESFPKNPLVRISSHNGKVLLEGIWDETHFSQFLEQLPGGLYVISAISSEKMLSGILLKH